MSNDLILSDPEIMGGTPCVHETRITVYVLAARRRSETVEQLLEDYPYITRAAIEAAVAYAARVPLVEDPDGRPWRKSKAQADVA